MRNFSWRPPLLPKDAGQQMAASPTVELHHYPGEDFVNTRAKKTITTLALVATASLSLSGCFKEATSVKVSPQQTVTGQTTALMNNNFLTLVKNSDDEIPGAADMTLKQYFTESFLGGDAPQASDFPRGVSVKVVSTKSGTGLKLTFSQSSLKSVNTVGKDLSPTPSKPLIKIKLDSKKRVVFSYRVLGGKDLGLSASDMKPFTGLSSYSVKTTFAGKVISTNGTVSKKTVTWKGKHGLKAKSLKATATRR